MSSGPSHILILSQAEGSANVVPAWREFIGPADTEAAKREMPERLVSRNDVCAISKQKAEKGPTPLFFPSGFDNEPFPFMCWKKSTAVWHSLKN